MPRNVPGAPRTTGRAPSVLSERGLPASSPAIVDRMRRSTQRDVVKLVKVGTDVNNCNNVPYRASEPSRGGQAILLALIATDPVVQLDAV